MAHQVKVQRILVVDDDEEIRLALRMLLEDAGYCVSEAPDGTAALRLMEESAEDLVVLLDNLMPGLDACELLEAWDPAKHDSCDPGGQSTPSDSRQPDEPTTARDSVRPHAGRHAFILVTASPQRVSSALATRLARMDAPTIAKPFELAVLTEAVAQAAARLYHAGKGDG